VPPFRFADSDKENHIMSHDKDGACSCCPTDPVEIDRNFADAIRGRAQAFLTKEGQPVAQALLSASRTMLAARGGVHGEKGVWLLVAEAHIPALDDKHAETLKIFEAALAMAEKDLGDEHMATGICLLNVADTLMQLNRAKDAKPLYDRAHKILKKVSADLKEKDEYLSNFAGDASAMALKGSQLAQEKLGQ